MWVPVGAFMALLFYLSHRQVLPRVPEFNDKVVHLLAYLVLGILCLRAFHGGLQPLRSRTTALGVALAVAYAITDELHQSFVPGREPSVMDFLADGAGVLLAVALLSLLHLARRRGLGVRSGASGRREA